MPTTTNDATLIRDLPVQLDAPSADVLGDALSDAVAQAPLSVDLDAEGPSGFARVHALGNRFQTWPAAVTGGAGGLWDRLAEPLDPAGTPSGDGTPLDSASLHATYGVRELRELSVPEGEQFQPDDAPVRPAGGDVPWPGACP